MNKGYFCDEKKEYIIQDMFPKRPLINYIWNEEYIMGVDHTGQGKGFASVGTGLRRDIFLPDCDNRLIYIKDEETGEYCCINKPFGKGKLKDYHCHVGIGVQKIDSEYKGIRSSFSMTVPVTGKAELWQLQLENLSGRSRKLSVYVYAKVHENETCHCSYNLCDWDEKVGGLYFSHIHYGAEHPYMGIYLCADQEVASYCTSDTRFRSLYHTLEHPLALEQPFLDNLGSSYDEYPSAALQFRMELEDTENYTVNLVVGLATDRDSAMQHAKKYLQEDYFLQTLEERKRNFDAVTGVYQLESGNPYLDRLTNVWLKNQVQLGKTWARVYGKGFRDMMQDITAFVSMDGKMARRKIVECLHYQFANGNTIRMFAPFLRHPYMDGATWIPETVLVYIKETGDLDFLKEEVPFFESEESGSVLEHMRRGIHFMLSNVGSHGLCLWGGGDWNDSIDNAGMQGVGEIVWLSIATVKACKQYAEILQLAEEKEEALQILQCAENLTSNIIKHGFENGYLIYGINDWDEKIGSKDCEEGKIYLNPQSWAVLAGIFSEEQCNELMDIVEERLHCDYGYVQCAPSYTKLDAHIGRASGFVPGSVENGSVYNHGVTFKIVADCKLGRAEYAYQSLRDILSDNPILEDSGVEPYAITNMYLGPDNPYEARFAPCSWITGTAGWMYRCITEYIFGVSAEFEGLKVAPCLSKELDNVKITRIYRGATYNICISRAEQNEVFCDGEKVDGNVLPIFERDTIHEVQVYITDKTEED